jgi:membrane associated rhomboid family serine protease
MTSELAAITASSERQAMDWSLVLVSQGIETWIERETETGRWLLVVPEAEQARAVEALQSYQLENRWPPWRRELPGVGLVFDLRCIGVLLFLALLFVLEGLDSRVFATGGAMDNRLVHAGEWWRIFTAVTLHADVAHLAANLSTGLVLLGLVMGAYGYGLGLLLSYLSGVAGFLGGCLLLPESYRSLGASGMLLGALGLLGSQWVGYMRHGFTTKEVAVRGVLSACLLLVLLGFGSGGNTDVLAHVTGFAAGLILGGIVSLLPRSVVEGVWANRLALLVTLVLVLGSWAIGLRH